MAYVSVAEWRPEQVTEWLKGLDNCIVSYLHWFSNNEVNGQQLLNLSPDELTHLGVCKLGHQELILEAVQHLRNFHYELDRENLQLLALKLSCAAHSLFSEIRDQAESSSVPTQIMADVANVIHCVKPLVSWLDRPPFEGQIQYSDIKSQLLTLSLEMATCAQRDRFAERPVAKIRTCSSKLAKLADSIVQDITDPMILQPATLDLATIKKKAGEDLDFFLVPSFHGIYQIGDMKLSSPAHQSGKIQQGDEIVQVNYQTVVGWSRKKVLALFEESPNDLLLTLKRRPRHVKIYGQIYMKPYRLPSRKRASPYARWNDNLPSPRPELLTIPHFDITRTNFSKKSEDNQNLLLEPSGTSSSSDEEFGQPSDSRSPASVRLYLPKPRASIQRRFTLSGPPRPSVQSEQFWRELQLERSWRSSQNNSQMTNSSSQNVANKDRNISEMFQLRDKSASLGNNIAAASSYRSATCVSFNKVRIGSVKFDSTKFDSTKNDLATSDKGVKEERDKEASETALKSSDSEANNRICDVTSEAESCSAIEPGKIHSSLSISVINKIKRDAFFKNMDCLSSQTDLGSKFEVEGNSEKVKRVIENFKSEIVKTKRDMLEADVLKSPGKVMELIENFEKKESKKNFYYPNKDDKPVKPVKERNRLDKSCSTPAYDTTETDPLDSAVDSLDAFKTHQKDFVRTSKDFSEKLLLDGKDVQRKSLRNYKDVKTNAENKNLTTKDPTKSNISFGNDFLLKDAGANSKLLIKNEPKKSENETMQAGCPITYKQSNAQDKDCNIPCDSRLENEVYQIKNLEIPLNSVKSEEIKNKPVPAQRKSKMSPEKCHNTNQGSDLTPLPPKPRTKLSQLSPEETQSTSASRAPPEPPPRPDSTFVKPLCVKKTEISADNKDQSRDLNSFRDSVKETADSGFSSRRNNVIISPPVPAAPHEFKPLSAAPVSPSRKPGKSFNILMSGASSSGEKEKTKNSGGTLESLKAMLTLGRKSGNINSPKLPRKKNATLAKKRNVSVKEITSFENSGFLWHRSRKGVATASWTKYYFILHGSNFYGFKSKESNKADLFIHLPGFTCTHAEEVKSKEFAFKIYHTGTVFYFAANSKEDLQQWLDSVNLAVSFQDEKIPPEAVIFSQTDSDASDTDLDPETCFPTTLKMKKVIGTSPVPKPARSHQNLASDSKKTHEIQKRFGSLKKLSSHKHSVSNTVFSNNGSAEVASLDRKYLRFLSQKSSPMPVPTSRFRSYRRMQPPPIVPPKGKPKVKSKNSEKTTDTLNSATSSNVEGSRLVRKPLHSSNPSLIHPDMADYRITQERLAEFRRLRNQNGLSDHNGFGSLDQSFSRQDRHLRFNRSRVPEMSGFMTLEQFLLCQDEERQRSQRARDGSTTSNDFSYPEPFFRTEDERQKFSAQNKTRVHHGQNNPSTSSQNVEAHSSNTEFEKLLVSPKARGPFSGNSGKMKTMHQLPGTSHSGLSSNQAHNINEESFETLVDQTETRKQTSSKHSTDSGSSKGVTCCHVKNHNETCQGIEYPPAFEPETYTIQHMLKTRQKKESEHKK